MNKNNKQGGFSGIAAIGIVAAVVVVVVMFGYFVFPKQSEKNEASLPVADTTNQELATVESSVDEKTLMEKKAMEDKDAIIKDGSTETDSMVKEETSKTDTMVKAGSYEAYSADKIARAESGDVVLFFHASWCPSCRGLNSDIEKNISAIPAGVTILKTDYDTQTELKKKYGVTYQHTLVQVDKDGNLIKKWSGSSSLAKLLSQIQ